jgi:hypothetical protein
MTLSRNRLDVKVAITMRLLRLLNLIFTLIIATRLVHSKNLSSCEQFYSRHPIVLTIGEGPKSTIFDARALSQINTSALIKEIGPLNAIEQVIFKRALAFSPQVTHRTSFEIFKEILKDAKLVSKK